MSWLRARGIGRWLAAPVDRPVGIQVEHTVAAADEVPTRHVLVTGVEAEIAKVDARLRAILEVPPPVRTDLMWWQLDRLLDLRNAIRPARVVLRPSVPVVPGRAS